MFEVKSKYFMNHSGIYCIKNLTNNKVYIGSSINIYNRLTEHFSRLKKNRHPNKQLQSDFKDSHKFICKVVFLCTKEELLANEFMFFNIYSNIYSMYNKTCGYKEFDINKVDYNKFYSICNKNTLLGCWNCKSKDYHSYSIDNKRYMAHRISYFINNPNDNQQQLICHTCNNKRCINPNHLYAGSFQENAKDNSETNLNFIYHNLIRNITYSNNMITRREILYLVNDYYDTSMSYDSFDNIINNKVSPNEDWKCPYILRDTEKLSNINWDIVHYIRCQTGKINEILQNVMKKYNITTTESTIRRIIKNKRWYDPNYIIQRQMAKLIR